MDNLLDNSRYRDIPWSFHHNLYYSHWSRWHHLARKDQHNLRIVPSWGFDRRYSPDRIRYQDKRSKSQSNLKKVFICSLPSMYSNGLTWATWRTAIIAWTMIITSGILVIAIKWTGIVANITSCRTCCCQWSTVIDTSRRWYIITKKLEWSPKILVLKDTNVLTDMLLQKTLPKVAKAPIF